MERKVGEVFDFNGVKLRVDDILDNSLEQVKLQLTREPRPLPRMALNPDMKNIFNFGYEDFQLTGYDPHPHIKGEVAI